MTQPTNVRVCRGALFDGGVSRVFDVVPEAGSGVSVERTGTGNRNGWGWGGWKSSGRRGQTVAFG
jgi:hypothetical protein